VLCPAKGCLAPVLVLVFAISNGPVAFKLKIMSAFESFEKISFLVCDGAYSSVVDQTLKLMCLSLSILRDLSIFKHGAIVVAAKFTAMMPREPGLGKSAGSSIISISS